MHKVVYNACYGGFGFGDAIATRYAELSGKPVVDDYDRREVVRHDPAFVQAVEESNGESGYRFSDLKIAEIPATRYRIEEYDGFERVRTPEDTDWIVIS